MRVLWISDSPSSPSGFGHVTRAICSRLAEAGHQVEILGWQTHGESTAWQGIPVRPIRFDMFGADVLLGYLMRIQPHFVVTLADVWWMSFLADPPIQRFLDQSRARWLLYYPIDGATADGGLPEGWRRVLSTADVPVAMSRFGVDVSAAAGIDCHYIPHGCDLDVFAPPADKAAAKARFGYEDRFVVLSDARNQPRKLLPRLLDIAALVSAERPGVLFHVHADPHDDASQTENYSYRILEDATALGLGAHVRFTKDFRMRSEAGLPLEELAALYQAADAHLLTSWGEGFGLPNLQAASAGLVPLAVDYSASRELVDRHGYALPTESTVTDEFGMVRHLVSREAAAAAIGELHDDPQLLGARSRASREFALAYDWDRLAEEWDELLRTAPPRRRPERSRSFDWVGGEGLVGAVPQPIAEVTNRAFAGLPDGVRLGVQVTERQYGAVAAQIRREAFADGDELAVPVRLPRLLADAPRQTIAVALVSPGDIELTSLLHAIFPALGFALPRSSGDLEDDELLDPAALAPALLHHVIAIDFSRTGGPGLDLACAALGVPYAGASPLWPGSAERPFPAVRRLLTDQGWSEWRRQVAHARALDLAREQVEAWQALALAGLGGRREAVA